MKVRRSSFPEEDQLEFFEELFGSADIGICVTDQDRCFVMVNPAYCRACGYSSDELIGQPFSKVLPPEVREHSARLHDEFLAGGNEIAGEWEVVDKHGRRRHVLITAGRVVLADGRRYQVTTVADLSETRQTEHELAKLSEVVARTSHGVIFTDAEGKITWANTGTLRMTGFTLEEMCGRKPGDLLQGPDSDSAVIAHMGQQLAAGRGFQVEIVNYSKSGQSYDLHIACSPVLDSAGQLEGYMALQTNITDRNLSEKQVARAQIEAHKLRTAINQSPVSIEITDCDGTIEFVNQACLDHSGYELEEVLGQNPRLFQSGLIDKAVFVDLWATISAGKTWQGRLVNRRKDGSEYVEWASISPVLDENSRTICYLAVKEDITAREQLSERMRSMERFDALTGLANRSAFFEGLEQRLAHLRPEKMRQPLALINIDRFHGFNALYGHEAGDRLLQQVARCLVAKAPKDTLVARLGPDEFAVLPPAQSRGKDSLIGQQDLQWIQRIQRALREGFEVDLYFQKIDVSIGIAIFGHRFKASNRCRPGDFLGATDAALRAAKARGGGQIAFFDADDSVQAQEVLRLEKHLTKAVARGEMHIVLQAQVRPDGGLVGAEALLRWRHATLGNIAPGRFIPLAEDSGQIVKIGHWVLEQALEVLAALQAFDRNLTISVNISPVQVRRAEFVDEIKCLLEGAGVIPSGLVLEITERVFIDDPETARERLQVLRDLGVGISIDDFGTGYSLLTYLKRLPVSELKIAQSFVDGLPDDESDMALVNIIMSAAQQLKLRVVAEGVETAAQAQYFNQRPDVVLQGFLFDRPSDIKEWMGKWSNRIKST